MSFGLNGWKGIGSKTGMMSATVAENSSGGKLSFGASPDGSSVHSCVGERRIWLGCSDQL